MRINVVMWLKLSYSLPILINCLLFYYRFSISPQIIPIFLYWQWFLILTYSKIRARHKQRNHSSHYNSLFSDSHWRLWTKSHLSLAYWILCILHNVYWTYYTLTMNILLLNTLQIDAGREETQCGLASSAKDYPTPCLWTCSHVSLSQRWESQDCTYSSSSFSR